jgi:hypothetical protein
MGGEQSLHEPAPRRDVEAVEIRSEPPRDYGPHNVHDAQAPAEAAIERNVPRDWSEPPRGDAHLDTRPEPRPEPIYEQPREERHVAAAAAAAPAGGDDTQPGSTDRSTG